MGVREEEWKAKNKCSKRLGSVSGELAQDRQGREFEENGMGSGSLTSLHRSHSLTLIVSTVTFGLSHFCAAGNAEK